MEGLRTVPSTLLGGSYLAQPFGGSPVDVHNYFGFMMSMATTDLEDRTPQENGCPLSPECPGRCPVGTSSFCPLQWLRVGRNTSPTLQMNTQSSRTLVRLTVQHFHLCILAEKPNPCTVGFHGSYGAGTQDIIFGARQERRSKRGPGTHGVLVIGSLVIVGPLCSTVVFHPGRWKLLWSSAPPSSSQDTGCIVASLTALAHSWRMKATMVAGA